MPNTLEERKAAQRKLDYKKLLETGEGRRVLWDILSLCNIYSIVGKSAAEMWIETGKRTIGITVINAICESVPNGYAFLLENIKGDLLIINEDEENG